MIGSIALISGLVLFVLLPIVALLQYYSPKRYSIGMNLFWIAVGLISWPLIPVYLSIKNKNKILNILFGLTFMVWLLSVNLWLIANPEMINAWLKQYMALAKGK